MIQNIFRLRRIAFLAFVVLLGGHGSSLGDQVDWGNVIVEIAEVYNRFGEVLPDGNGHFFQLIETGPDNQIGGGDDRVAFGGAILTFSGFFYISFDPIVYGLSDGEWVYTRVYDAPTVETSSYYVDLGNPARVTQVMDSTAPALPWAYDTGGSDPTGADWVPVVPSTNSVDLLLTKTASHTNREAGQKLDYILSLLNTSPDTATSVTVMDLLPEGLTLLDATATHGTYTSTSGIWSVGTLGGSASASLTLETWVALRVKNRANFVSPTPAVSNVFASSCSAFDSGRVLLGAPKQQVSGITNAGSVYLCSTNGSILRTLLDPASAALDAFGTAVALVGSDWIAVGTDQDAAGTVYVFMTNGIPLLTLTNPTPEVGDGFGQRIVGWGTDRIIVGAPMDDPGGITNAGSVYIYGTNGVLQHSIINPALQAGDQFGASLAPISQNRFLVGADLDDPGGQTDVGTVFMYGNDASFVMTIPSPTSTPSCYFGSSLASLGAAGFAIGSPGHRIDGSTVGAVHLYSEAGAFVRTIQDLDPMSGDAFGSSIAVLGSNTLVVGVTGRTWNAESDAGLVRVVSTNGVLLASVTNPSPSAADAWGSVVTALGNNRFLVGSGLMNAGGVLDSGGAGLYDLDGSGGYITNRAYLSALQQPDSNTSNNQAEVAFLVGSAFIARPPAPQLLVVSNGGPSSFVAAWSGSDSTNYVLQVSVSTGFASFVDGYSGRSLGAVDTHTVTGLGPVSVYYYRVRGENMGGAGEWSATGIVTTKVSLTVAALPDGVGTVSPMPGEYVLDQLVTTNLSAAAPTSFIFYAWTNLQGASIGNPASLQTVLSMTSNATVGALFLERVSTNFRVTLSSAAFDWVRFAYTANVTVVNQSAGERQVKGPVLLASDRQRHGYLLVKEGMITNSTYGFIDVWAEFAAVDVDDVWSPGEALVLTNLALFSQGGGAPTSVPWNVWAYPYLTLEGLASWMTSNGLIGYPSSAFDDADGDGQLAWEEYVSGTDPRDAASVLAIAEVIPADDGTAPFDVIHWKSATGKIYSVLGTTNLFQSFAALSGVMVATAPTNVFTNTVMTNVHPIYYRLRVQTQ